MDTPRGVITTVRLRNFMCYRDEIAFDFSPTVTAIMGSNDRGKSTILAAIQWCVWGKPVGDTVESWNGDRDTWVELTFDDGTTVTRYREKGVNRYAYRRDGKTETLQAIGNNVPEAITNLLRLDEINFQGQASNLFPFQLTPGEFGRVVNRHCNLDDVYTTIKRISAESRAWTQQETIQKAIEHNTSEEIKRLDWIDDVQMDMTAGLEILAEIEEKRAAVERGQMLISNVHEYREQIQRLSAPVGKVEAFIKEARQLYSALRSQKAKYERVSEALDRIELLEIEQQASDVFAAQSQKLTKARALFDDIRSLEAKAERIREVTRSIETRRYNIERYTDELNDAQKTVENIRAQLPAICPLCRK